MYSTVQWRAAAGCHFYCTRGGGNIPPFILNINKRQRRATEERIKEKYSWQQADKKVIKAVRKYRKERQTEKLVFCPQHYLLLLETLHREMRVLLGESIHLCTIQKLLSNYKPTQKHILINADDLASTLLFPAFST